MRKWIRRLTRRLILAGISFVIFELGFQYYYTKVFPIASILDEHVHQDVMSHHVVYLPLSDVPTLFTDALIATEDKRFETNPGIDPTGIIRSLIVNIKNRDFREGGSTITQQVVRNVLLTPDKTLSRKLKEVILSFAAYEHVCKPQIMEYYINDVYFGHGAYGIAQAAQVYFHKSVTDLTNPQLTLLAGLPNAPSLDDPFQSLQAAKSRQHVILNELVLQGTITSDQANDWYEQSVQLARN